MQVRACVTAPCSSFRVRVSVGRKQCCAHLFAKHARTRCAARSANGTWALVQRVAAHASIATGPCSYLRLLPCLPVLQQWQAPGFLTCCQPAAVAQRFETPALESHALAVRCHFGPYMTSKMGRRPQREQDTTARTGVQKASETRCQIGGFALRSQQHSQSTSSRAVRVQRSGQQTLVRAQLLSDARVGACTSVGGLRHAVPATHCLGLLVSVASSPVCSSEQQRLILQTDLHPFFRSGFSEVSTFPSAI